MNPPWNVAGVSGEILLQKGQQRSIILEKEGVQMEAGLLSVWVVFGGFLKPIELYPQDSSPPPSSFGSLWLAVILNFASVYGLSPQRGDKNGGIELASAGWLVDWWIGNKDLDLPNAQCLPVCLGEMVGAELTDSFCQRGIKVWCNILLGALEN